MAVVRHHTSEHGGPVVSHADDGPCVLLRPLQSLLGASGVRELPLLLQTFTEFPRRQEPASFNLDKVLAKLQEGIPSA
ncbi:hypothetical protein FB565_006200 [Actinoplanes lutulentus]|uniref:Uncharacterized protein n=1 Tax=Actinoplanes lutulentus TaxID=1287878 RepID=A0A327YVZ4_9ACTN|nr:hypothetical protein [Actinoplanes lutulentus]MBB2946432.1 hypothetical protein [Actinoplanes lutulentus]RAK25408.1 hypothetical protein B0I29_13418 [Actinoplanes lutulentus]